jgi:hypothetical protein
VILAIIAAVAPVHMATWALGIDVQHLGRRLSAFAFYKGQRVNLDPGSLGASFYIVTAVVRPLLVSHALIFTLLLHNHTC